MPPTPPAAGLCVPGWPRAGSPQDRFATASRIGFNVCASTADGRLVCPISGGAGGFEELPPYAGGEFSVDQWSYCNQTDELIAYCTAFGADNTECEWPESYYRGGLCSPEPGSDDSEDCPEPIGGTAQKTWNFGCYLFCDGELTCPDGMECVDVGITICAWPGSFGVE